jgi:hypothetical protein
MIEVGQALSPDDFDIRLERLTHGARLANKEA